MNCPRCKSSDSTKNGIVGGRQRYRCSRCGYNYTVEKKSTAYPESVKKQALQLYLEGLGFRSIGRFLNIGNKKNYCWIWIAVDRDGKKFIDCSFGSRGTETGEKLWDKLKEKEIGGVMTDHWRA